GLVWARSPWIFPVPLRPCDSRDHCGLSVAFTVAQRVQPHLGSTSKEPLMHLGFRFAVVFAASLLATGCAPGGGAGPGDESVDGQHSAYSSSSTTVGDWHNLPDGVECLVGMQGFYPAQFGVSIPIAPESWSGDCAPEGACHLWLDARPDSNQWEAVSSGTPST